MRAQALSKHAYQDTRRQTKWTNLCPLDSLQRDFLSTHTILHLAVLIHLCSKPLIPGQDPDKHSRRQSALARISYHLGVTQTPQKSEEKLLWKIWSLTISPKYEIRQKPRGRLTVCILLMPGQRRDLHFSYCFPLFPGAARASLFGSFLFWPTKGKKTILCTNSNAFSASLPERPTESYSLKGGQDVRDAAQVLCHHEDPSRSKKEK